MYVVSGIIIAFIVINYFLGYKLYSVPKNEKYFNNVTALDFSKGKYICPEPRYVILISIFTGVMIGIYVALASILDFNKWIALIVVLLICVCYLIEITRAIIIRDDKLILSKIFSKKVELYGNDIKGMYIYSYNKKFLKRHALTTKLVIITKIGKTYKFVLSSLNNKSVLNMMKENFGVTEYKMFISKKSEDKIKETV